MNVSLSGFENELHDRNLGNIIACYVISRPPGSTAEAGGVRRARELTQSSEDTVREQPIFRIEHTVEAFLKFRIILF